MISGIVHRLRKRCTWRAAAAVYGRYTTVSNRYNRWSRRGPWFGGEGTPAGCRGTQAARVRCPAAVVIWWTNRVETPGALACIPADPRASAFTLALLAMEHRSGLVVVDRCWLTQGSDRLAGAAKMQRKCTQISRDGREWSGVVHPPVHRRRRVPAS